MPTHIRALAAFFFAATVALPASDAAHSSGLPRVARWQARAYVPPPDGQPWERVDAKAAGFDAVKLDSAIAFARSRELPWNKDMAAQLKVNNAREPYPDVLGPYKDKGIQSGLVLRHGYIVAEWGDTNRIDMTYSVAKSYLSSVVGLAYDKGMIKDVDAPIGQLVKDGGYDSPHNAKITWRMALTQTSEWEGTLWDKPDVADRRKGYDRKLNEPGTFYEYNDVRVNRTALSALRVWHRPLPEVLAEYIMTPIGASNWVWYGYENSFTMESGRRVQSVSGGGHWGGGVWATTRDHARYGLLMLRKGKWGDRQLLSEKWIAQATTTSTVQPGYGFLWWLNTPAQPSYKSATPTSFFARGNGGNTIWICPEKDMVVVVRWLSDNAQDQFFGRVLAAISE